MESRGTMRRGLPYQEPVNADPSALNFGSARPPLDKLPDGLDTV